MDNKNEVVFKWTTFKSFLKDCSFILRKNRIFFLVLMSSIILSSFCFSVGASFLFSTQYEVESAITERYSKKGDYDRSYLTYNLADESTNFESFSNHYNNYCQKSIRSIGGYNVTNRSFFFFNNPNNHNLSLLNCGEGIDVNPEVVYSYYINTDYSYMQFSLLFDLKISNYYGLKISDNQIGVTESFARQILESKYGILPDDFYAVAQEYLRDKKFDLSIIVNGIIENLKVTFIVKNDVYSNSIENRFGNYLIVGEGFAKRMSSPHIATELRASSISNKKMFSNNGSYSDVLSKYNYSYMKNGVLISYTDKIINSKTNKPLSIFCGILLIAVGLTVDILSIIYFYKRKRLLDSLSWLEFFARTIVIVVSIGLLFLLSNLLFGLVPIAFQIASILVTINVFAIVFLSAIKDSFAARWGKYV